MARYLDELELLEEACGLEADNEPQGRGRRPAAEALMMGLWRWRQNLMRDARSFERMCWAQGGDAGEADAPPADDFPPLLELMQASA